MKYLTIRIWDELVDSYNNAADDIELEDAQYTAAKYGARLVAAGCDINKLVSMMNKRDVIKIYPAIRKRLGRPWTKLLDFYKQDQDFVYLNLDEFLACDVSYDEIVMFLSKRVEYRKVTYLLEFIKEGASHSNILKIIEKCSDSNTQWECGYRTGLIDVLKSLRNHGCAAETIKEWIMNLHPRYWKWIFDSDGDKFRLAEIIGFDLAQRYWLELFGYSRRTGLSWRNSLKPNDEYGDKLKLINEYFHVRPYSRSRWTKMTRIGDIKPLNIETVEDYCAITDEELGLVCFFTRRLRPYSDEIDDFKKAAVSAVIADRHKLVDFSINLNEGSILLTFVDSRETRSSKIRQAFFDTLGVMGAV